MKKQPQIPEGLLFLLEDRPWNLPTFLLFPHTELGVETFVILLFFKVVKEGWLAKNDLNVLVNTAFWRISF